MTSKGVPKEVLAVGETLQKSGFEGFLVGGCVRDLLLGKAPKDWDIATNAKPEQIQKLFPDSIYENTFGTVGVKTDSEDQSLRVIEVTTYRLEGRYTDMRHPDEVKFAKTIEDDLARRDFTINALAIPLTHNTKLKTNNSYDLSVISYKFEVVDPFGGQKDLKAKLIRAVGNPEERFTEDALRLMRAVRFSAQLDFSAKGGPASGWKIEEKTDAAIKKHANLLEFIAKERVRDEFVKLVMADGAVSGIEKMRELGLLKYALPELEEGVGVGQNKHHIYTVYEHNMRSFKYAVDKNFPLDLRIASLLHDIGKPRTKQGAGINSTFYGHQVVGERMAVRVLDRLRFPKHMVEKIALLIREHMFVYDPETVTLAGVRRLLRRVGTENVDDLFLVREADRIGSGVPKAQPYRLRYLKAMVEKVQKDPISPKMLKIKGEAVMEILKIEPGPRVGKILAVLLDEVLENPELNEGDKLKERVIELGKFSDQELEKLSLKAKKNAEEAQRRIDGEIKKKYFVE